MCFLGDWLPCINSPGLFLSLFSSYLAYPLRTFYDPLLFFFFSLQLSLKRKDVFDYYVPVLLPDFIFLTYLVELVFVCDELVKHPRQDLMGTIKANIDHVKYT